MKLWIIILFLFMIPLVNSASVLVYSGGTMDADDVFSSEIQAADLVIFKSVTFIPEDYYYAPFPDGTPKILTFFTYGRMIFENCNIEVTGENGDTPSNGRGGDGGTATLLIMAIKGAEFVDSNITLIGGEGGNADYQDTNIELRGGNGGEALLRFGQSETVRGNVFFNENSSINITTFDGGDAYASGSGDYEYEEDGGDGGNIYLLGGLSGGLSNFTSDSEVYLHAGSGGTGAANANGQYYDAAGSGGDAGDIEINNFQNFEVANIDFKTSSGGLSKCDAGTDSDALAYGGNSGQIWINLSGNFELNSVSGSSFIEQGSPGTCCAEASGAGLTASLDGVNGAPVIFECEDLKFSNHTINISLGYGGDSDSDGDTTSDGGDASTLYFNSTTFEISNSTLNIKTFPAGNEHGDQGADGGKSDILFYSNFKADASSRIRITQDASENICAMGGDIHFRNDLINISGASIYLNASQGGGAANGGDSNCAAGHGGYIIINSTNVNLIDTSLHLQSGYGDSGTRSNANSGNVELTIPGELALDNSTLWLQTNIKQASSSGANVGNLSALINNFTMDNSELRYTEGEPADAVDTRFNVTGYSNLNDSIINFTSVTTATTADIFFGYELNLINSNLTNNSHSAANWTFQSIGWPYQFNRSYFSINGSSCNPDLNIRLSSDNHSVRYYLPDYAACAVNYLGNLNTSNESTTAQYYTRIQNVTPVPNGSLAWANGGFSCFTQFTVYDSSATDNATTNNFASSFSVGNSAWCNLRLNSSTFNHTSNVTTTIVKSYPYDWTLYIGGQSVNESSGEFNSSFTTHVRGGINYWNQYQCTPDTCYIPINFTSNSSDSKMNLSLVFAEWGVDSPVDGDYQVPIVITSNSSGDLNLSGYYFEYYDGLEIEMEVTTNTSITRIINISNSHINISQAYDYIEFYPASLSSKNVTPYGQNETFPFYNITYDANRDFELAVLLNETMPACMNISISKDNNSQYHVLNTSAYELTNMTVNESIGLWLKLDMSSCNRTALHALYTVDAYFDSCCSGCVPCFD